MERKRFIGLAGTIGVGKTTLATALATHFDLPVYYEPVKDNPYLDDFYNDIKKYAFPMQIYLLNSRFRHQQSVIWSDRGGVQDRTIYEDCIFAKMLYDDGLIEERDYRTYVNLFDNMNNFIRKPDVIVYLDIPPEEALVRIRVRGRSCESSITLEYLQKLHRAYGVFIRDIEKSVRVIKIDYREFMSVDDIVQLIG